MPQVNLQNIKSIRKALGKSQSELAELLGISTRAVQSYEQGWRPLPPLVQKMAGLLLLLKRRGKSGKIAPCWEICRCGASLRSDCQAYQYGAGDFCWLVTNNCFCGRKLKTWEAKMARCRNCAAMKQWLDA